MKNEEREDHRRRGVALREYGFFEEAIASFERAVALDPRDGQAHRFLAETRGVADKAHRAQIEALLADPLVVADARIELHFALFILLDREGRTHEAFEHLRAGNTLRRAQFTYDEADVHKLLDLLRTMFSAPLVTSVAGRGNPSELPVFIFGMPRSGTTLVEQMLAAHPLVQAGGELDAFECAFAEAPPVTADPRDARAFVAELGAMMHGVGTRYLEALQPIRDGALRVTDKMPGNLRFAAAIRCAFPNAKLVHVRRDPIDTCLSCYATNFSDGHLYAYDLTELGRYYRLYEEHLAGVRAALGPNDILEVGYEELVADFETQARRIVAFCGLEWDPACLEFWRVQRPVTTASVVQVRQPLYTRSVGRWKRYERELQPLLVALFPDNAAVQANLGYFHVQRGDAAGAIAAYETALRLDPGNAEARRGLAVAKHQAGIAVVGDAVSTTPYRGSGRAVRVLVPITLGSGNVVTENLFDDRTFEVVKLAVELHPPDAPLPEHDVVFNVVGEADSSSEALEGVRALLARTGAHVVNPPERVIASGRAAVAERLAKLDGVVVPSIARVTRSEVASLALPVLLRAPGYHAGEHFVRIATESEREAAVASLPGDAFFAIGYVDTREPDGLFAKYRVMAIDGALYPLHLAIARDWKVHYFSAAMAENAGFREREARFLADPRAAIGARAWDALERVAAAVGLDYMGIDFGLDAHGNVVVFETNATMAVRYPPGDPMWEYRRPAVDAVLSAVRAMLVRYSPST